MSTATDWLSAIGTTGGTLVVGGALWWEIHQRRKDNERAADERRDAEAMQARLVSISVAMSPTRFMIRVVNDSDGPIRGITYTSVWQPPGKDAVRRQLVDRTMNPPLVAARDEITADCLARDIPEDTPREEIDLELRFTDAHGVRWVITGNDDKLNRVLDEV